MPCNASPVHRSFGCSASNRPNTDADAVIVVVSPSRWKFRCRVRSSGAQPSWVHKIRWIAAAVRSGFSRRRHEYVLTELGRSLRPVIVALAAWGNVRLDPSERSMVLVDSETGVEAEPILVDRATGRRVDGPDFIFTAGPAASEPFRDRYARHPTPASTPRWG